MVSFLLILNGNLPILVVSQLTTSTLVMRMLLLHCGVIMTFGKKVQFVMLRLWREKVLEEMRCSE